MNTYQKVLKLLKKAKTVLIISHVDPDGDSIGSALALERLLSKLKIKSTLISVDGVPKVYRFLPGANRFKKIIPRKICDLAITIDCGDLKRVGPFDLKKVTKIIVNIDHHPDNTLFGQINLAEPISATAEHIYRLAKLAQIKIDKEMATDLYTAIITDTGNFRYDNTTPEILEAAADLVKSGAKPDRIAHQVYETKTPSALKILGMALAGIEKSKDGKVAWTVITQDMIKKASSSDDELSGLVDYLRSIRGVEVAVLIHENRNGKVKINLRSKEKVNVSEIARKLGGGGHIRAAGAILEGKPEEVKKKVLDTVLRLKF